MTTYPICIAGAGPAGMTAAFFLNQLGIDHCILEAKTFPREKVCGEVYDGRVARILDEISPELLPKMKAAGIVEESWNYQLDFGRASLPIAFDRQQRPRLQTQRREFDAFLANQLRQQAHTSLCEQTKVLSWEADTTGVTVNTNNGEFRAGFLLLATGAQAFPALVTSKTQNRKSTSERGYYLRAYFEGMPLKHRATLISYFYDPLPGMYCLNPVSRGRTSVMLWADEAQLKARSMTLPQVGEQLVQSEMFRTRYPEARACGPWQGTFMPVQQRLPLLSQARVLPTGAAWLSVNTATGMGLGNAMTTGKYAALHLAANLDRPPHELLAQQQQFYRKMRKRLKNVLLLNRLLNFIQRNARWLAPVLSRVLRWNVWPRLLQQSDLVHRLRRPGYYWRALKGK